MISKLYRLYPLQDLNPTFLFAHCHAWVAMAYNFVCFFAGSSAKNKGQLSSVMFSLSLAILLSKHTYFHVFLLFSIPES